MKRYAAVTLLIWPLEFFVKVPISSYFFGSKLSPQKSLFVFSIPFLGLFRSIYCCPFDLLVSSVFLPSDPLATGVFPPF